MSSRQKSFFDQEHGSKQSRPQWHRARSANEAYKKPSLDKRDLVMTGPPIQPSTLSRTKLKKFQFIDGAPEKENMPEDTAPARQPDTSASAVPNLARSNTCPATPGPTRRPLDDMEGPADSINNQALSPQEEIGWRGGTQTLAPPAKSRKRARSSSPPSASQNETSDIFCDGTAMETPRADPKAEVWKKYYNKHASIMETPYADKASDMALPDSSPRVGAFKRWVSLPDMIGRKKRRTVGGFRQAMDEDGNEDIGLPKFSRPSMGSKLRSRLEAVQQTLGVPSNHLNSGPSSSEPLPTTTVHSPDPEADGSGSPQDVRTSVSDAHMENNVAVAPPDFSEFGDDIDDKDLLEVADDTCSTARKLLYSIPELPPPRPAVRRPSGGAASQKDSPKRRSAKTPPSSDDEFGGDVFDDDEFVAVVEQAVSQRDPRPSAGVAEPQETAGTMKSDPETLVIEDDDEFGDFGIDEEAFVAAEIQATQGLGTSGDSNDRNARTIQRYHVTNVVEGQYKAARGMQPEKVLLVEEERTKKIRAIALREAWFDTRCTPGSYVHVIGDFTSTGQCTIDNENNMIILHPDHLISATTIGDSFGCMRKAVLQDRIKATSDANEAAMVGTILHEIFQEALKANRWDHEWLVDLIQRSIPRMYETILEIGVTVNHIIERLVGKIPQIQAWAKLFVKAQPGPDAVVKDRNGKTALMSINKLLEVEEHIWSPMYGLKGNIDATVQVLVRDESGEKTLTVPFELKTGRAVNISHQAQTALYTLLMSDRYDIDILYGVLFYLESSDMSRVRAIRHEIRQMVIQRNELACYVRERLELPPMLTDSHQCNRCYAQETCFLYHRLAEDGAGETLGMPAKQKFEELVRNLRVPHQEFFRKWDALLTKEESEMKRFHRELWTMLSEEREKLGRCFANVTVDPGSFKELPGGQKINKFQYNLVKHSAPASFSFTESQVTVGEPIVISDEKGHFALANGYVVSVRKRSITVAVDRRLHNARIRQPDFDADTKQAFVGLMDVTTGAVKSAGYDEEPILYRLDKDEFSNGMALVRNNLIQLMNDGDFRSVALRSLIVDEKAPTFKSSPSGYSIRAQSQMTMNSDQEAAVEKVFSAQDYALVLGMPGTGKTTTIAHIIRSLVAKGKSVLLTSYTHTAVDNILLKIREDGIGILRLGAAAKIHPDVQGFATIAAHPASSIEELERTWKDPPVVATTCLTINHPIFRRRLFDYCIVDEASQITLPVCLGPIRMAKRFILVGDHYQLPPLVQNKQAQEGGLDVSLFRLLSESHPEAVVTLEHQYRMCADVMLLPNKLIYDGRLKCGNDSVANRSLSIPNMDALQRHHHSSEPQRSRSSNPFVTPIDASLACPSPTSTKCWLTHALSPANKAVFLNTDALLPASAETLSGTRILNPLESTLVVQLVESFLTTGVPASEIGVITFYRSQLALLRQGLRHRAAALELHTADKFQGRDKEVVILSCVRSNDACSVGELLRDWRRINVAVTRARSKLVIVGSARTLKGAGVDVLKGVVGICERRGWVRDIRPGEMEGHVFDECGTQATQHGSPPKAVSQIKAESPKVEKKNKARAKPLGERDGNVGVGTTGSPVKKKVLGESGGGRGLKVPEKRGRVGAKTLLGKRPVLRDIVNDALGDL